MRPVYTVLNRQSSLQPNSQAILAPCPPPLSRPWAAPSPPLLLPDQRQVCAHHLHVTAVQGRLRCWAGTSTSAGTSDAECGAGCSSFPWHLLPVNATRHDAAQAPALPPLRLKTAALAASTALLLGAGPALAADLVLGEEVFNNNCGERGRNGNVGRPPVCAERCTRVQGRSCCWATATACAMARRRPTQPAAGLPWPRQGCALCQAIQQQRQPCREL